MKVLVTGATGFIGQHLVRELASKGYYVKCLMHRRTFSDKKLEKIAELVTGDITDATSIKEALKDVDVVFHLAALLGRWQSEYMEHIYYRVNSLGTKLLVKQAMKMGVKLFIYLSTTGVFGNIKRCPVNENHPCNPTFPYEKSKCIAEQAVKSAIDKGFPATIIRPSHVYGPGDVNTLKILKIIKRFRVFPLIDGGRAMFQPIYVEDLVKALVLCMEKRKIAIGKTYIIAGNERITFKDFIQLSAELLGASITYFSVPGWLMSVLALICEKIFPAFNLEPPLTRSRVEFFRRNHCYSVDKIRKELGFQPKTNLRNGLKKTIEWYAMKGLL